MSRVERKARETRKTRLSIIGTILLVAGVSLAFFPFLTNVYSRHILGAGNVETPGLIQEEDSSPAISAHEEALEYQRGIETAPVEKPVPQDMEIPQELIEDLEGVLEIPALDLQVKIVYGVELDLLRKAPGFYPQGQYPGQGNVSIAGHRTTYGAWFRHLDKLEKGDALILHYDDQVFRFRLAEVFPTHTRDWSVIAPTARPALTLTTCHPPGWATQRLVARAYLVKEGLLPHQP